MMKYEKLICYSTYDINEHATASGFINSVALVRKRTTLTEQPPLVGEVSANFCG
jgi:hypothetical protein